MADQQPIAPQDYRLPDDACFVCGAKDGPLYPREEPMGPGVVRDTAVCAEHTTGGQP